METSPKDARHGRTLHPCDIPQNSEDAAALKLLAAVDRQPQVEIIRIAFYTRDKGVEGIAYLELRSTGRPEEVGVGNLYARIELPLATIFKAPVEELTALLKGHLTCLTMIASSGETPSRATLMAN